MLCLFLFPVSPAANIYFFLSFFSLSHPNLLHTALSHPSYLCSGNPEASFFFFCFSIPFHLDHVPAGNLGFLTFNRPFMPHGMPFPFPPPFFLILFLLLLISFNFLAFSTKFFPFGFCFEPLRFFFKRELHNQSLLTELFPFP